MYSQQPPSYPGQQPQAQWNNNGPPQNGQWSNQSSQWNPNGPTPSNPVDTSLPSGWTKQWNAQYNAWFYVNTQAQPPVSQWNHPGNFQQQQQYSPPPTIPSSFSHGPSSQIPSSNDQRAFNTGYGQPPLTQQPQQQQSFGGAPPPPVSGPPPPPITKANKPKPGMSGLMGAGLGAAGGLALGALVNHEWKEHKKHEDQKEESAYEAGLHQGQAQHSYGGGSSGGYGGGQFGGYGGGPSGGYGGGYGGSGEMDRYDGGINGGYGNGMGGNDDYQTVTTVHREVHQPDGSWYEEDTTTTQTNDWDQSQSDDQW